MSEFNYTPPYPGGRSASSGRDDIEQSPSEAPRRSLLEGLPPEERERLQDELEQLYGGSLINAEEAGPRLGQALVQAQNEVPKFAWDNLGEQAAQAHEAIWPLLKGEITIEQLMADVPYGQDGARWSKMWRAMGKDLIELGKQNLSPAGRVRPVGEGMTTRTESAAQQKMGAILVVHVGYLFANAAYAQRIEQKLNDDTEGALSADTLRKWHNGLVINFNPNIFGTPSGLRQAMLRPINEIRQRFGREPVVDPYAEKTESPRDRHKPTTEKAAKRDLFWSDRVKESNSTDAETPFTQDEVNFFFKKNEYQREPVNIKSVTTPDDRNRIRLLIANFWAGKGPTKQPVSFSKDTIISNALDDDTQREIYGLQKQSKQNSVPDSLLRDHTISQAIANVREMLKQHTLQRIVSIIGPEVGEGKIVRLKALRLIGIHLQLLGEQEIGRDGKIKKMDLSKYRAFQVGQFIIGQCDMLAARRALKTGQLSPVELSDLAVYLKKLSQHDSFASPTGDSRLGVGDRFYEMSNRLWGQANQSESAAAESTSTDSQSPSRKQPLLDWSEYE